MEELTGFYFYEGDGFDTPHVSAVLSGDDNFQYYARDEVDELVAALRARAARLESITRMLIGCIEDTKKYPDMHDDFVDELETARRALEEK